MRTACQTIAITVLTLALMAPGVDANPLQAGETAATLQHHGSTGRMIGLDQMGNVHVSWMWVDASWADRHVYYNVLISGADEFSLGQGNQIDAAFRAGFITQTTLPSGFTFPAYHVLYVEPELRVAWDFLPATGAFSDDNVGVPNTLYPKIAGDASGNLHVVAFEADSEMVVSGELVYLRGTPIYNMSYCEGIDWDNLDPHTFGEAGHTYSYAHEIACSRTSDRVARAWTAPGNLTPPSIANNEVYLQISEDGGDNWSPPANLTQFVPPDSNCYNQTGDWRCCTRDSLRAFTDMSILFDDDDNIHLAFTTISFFYWCEGDEFEPMAQPTKARIWSWSELTEDFHLIAEATCEDSLLPGAPELGAYRALVEGPSLSYDPFTGRLYCTYTEYDTSAYSSLGFRYEADLYTSVSTDGGASWSVGTNVTNTHPAVSPAPAGENRIEQDVSAAELVVNGNLHLFYLLDVNGVDWNEIPPIELNPMLYRTVPVNSIAATPLMPDLPIHVEWDCIESADEPRSVPADFTLRNPFPNPFNASTTIEFQLNRATTVTVSVYDALGREAAVLQSKHMSPGHHSITWSPEARQSSGIYFLRFATPDHIEHAKALYLK